MPDSIKLHKAVGLAGWPIYSYGEEMQIFLFGWKWLPTNELINRPVTRGKFHPR